MVGTAFFAKPLPRNALRERRAYTCLREADEKGEIWTDRKYYGSGRNLGGRGGGCKINCALKFASTGTSMHRLFANQAYNLLGRVYAQVNSKHKKIRGYFKSTRSHHLTWFERQEIDRNLPSTLDRVTWALSTTVKLKRIPVQSRYLHSGPKDFNCE